MITKLSNEAQIILLILSALVLIAAVRKTGRAKIAFALVGFALIGAFILVATSTTGNVLHTG